MNNDFNYTVIIIFIFNLKNTVGVIEFLIMANLVIKEN